MSKEAMKLALEAADELEWMLKSGYEQGREGPPRVHRLIGKIKALAAAPQPAQSTADKSELETVPANGGLLPAQQALDKMAENARELGLDYEPAQQQEPVATTQEVIGCFDAAFAEGLQEALAETTDERLKDLVERRLMHALYAAQQGPVCIGWDDKTDTPIMGYTSPPAQRKPLTDEQINKAAEDEDNETAFLVGFYAGARFAEAAHGIKGEA